MHNTLAILLQERPVFGLADQQVWAWEEQIYKRNESKASRRKPTNRQSLRWGAAVKAIGKPAEQVQWVYVAARESDIFEYLETILKQGVDFCIRLVQERQLAEWTAEQPVCLLKTVRTLPEMGQRTLAIPAALGKQLAKHAWSELASRRNTPGDERQVLT